MFPVGQKIPARGHALPGRHQVLVRSVRVHDVLLIAVMAVACRLEDETLSIWSPVRLGVLSSMRQLLQISEVDLGEFGLRLGLTPKPKGKKEQGGSKKQRCAE